MTQTFAQWVEESNILFWVDGEEYVLYGENGSYVWTDYQNQDESVNNSLSRLVQRIRNEQSEYGVNPTPLWKGWMNTELAMRHYLGNETVQSFLNIEGLHA